MKTMLWMHIANAGDGGAYVKFFNTEAEARFSAEQDDERFCSDVQSEVFEFDENGKLLNPNRMCNACGQDIY